MSFILDALKKSENERARQNGPARLEARVVPRRRGVPPWAYAIGLVLIANLAVLSYVLLRTAGPPVQLVIPPAVGNVAAPPPTAPVRAPVVAPQPQPQQLPPLPDAEPTVIAPLPVPPPSAASAAVVNPADFQPARPAESLAPLAPPATLLQQALDANLPLAADLTATGLPELKLALHVYDENPGSRYVLLNSQRLREGETTLDGVRVERINPDAVVLSWRGQRFRLQPGG
jgi:general secretion pathway protein B